MFSWHNIDANSNKPEESDDVDTVPISRVSDPAGDNELPEHIA